MVQEQWLQLEMMFLMGYNMKVGKPLVGKAGFPK